MEQQRGVTHVNQTLPVPSINIFYQAPRYLLLGMSEVSTAVTGKYINDKKIKRAEWISQLGLKILRAEQPAARGPDAACESQLCGPRRIAC